LKERLRRAARASTMGMGLVLLWSSGAGAAESGGLALEWNAAEDCPDQSAAEAAIRDILGRRGATETKPDTVKVDITRLPSGRWEVQIETFGDSGTGHRRFEGSSCERVAEAAFLIVAMALDPLAVAHEVKAARTEATHRTVEPVSVEPVSTVEHSKAEHARPLLGLRIGGDVGSLPGPALGLSGLLGFQDGPLRIEGDGTLWLPRQALAGPTVGSGGEIGLYTGGLRGCLEAVLASGSSLRLGVCVGGEVGVQTGHAIGILPGTSRSGVWALGLGGLSLRQVSPSGLTYGLSLDAGAPIRRPSFVIDNYGQVFQASAIVGRASVDVAWIFP
jgi:hypothetical protein